MEGLLSGWLWKRTLTHGVPKPGCPKPGRVPRRGGFQAWGSQARGVSIPEEGAQVQGISSQGGFQSQGPPKH